MVVAGFLISARYGTEAYLDPILPFSPVLFIAGVVLMFGSAVVYELIPDSSSPMVPEKEFEPAPGPGERIPFAMEEPVLTH